LRLPPLRASSQRAFVSRVRALLAEAEWDAPPGATLYLVGGSFRSFARAAMQQLAWPCDDPHGFVLPAQQALAMARTLAANPAETLAPVPGIGSARLAALPDAAALLHALIRTLSPQRLVFSSWGLREGLLFSALDPATRAEDPLIAGTTAFAGQQGCPPEAGPTVAQWIAPAVAGDDEALRLAAVTLALASVAVEPNLRADLATDWALRKRWIGIDGRGRAMLAAALMANTGRMDLPRAWHTLANAADLATGQAWGLAVRLCRRLSGGTAGALAASSLALEEGTVQLTVRGACSALVNEGVERDLKALANRLGRKPVCRLIA